jgi:hypothetical protein
MTPNILADTLAKYEYFRPTVFFEINAAVITFHLNFLQQLMRPSSA